MSNNLSEGIAQAVSDEQAKWMEAQKAKGRPRTWRGGTIPNIERLVGQYDSTPRPRIATWRRWLFLMALAIAIVSALLRGCGSKPARALAAGVSAPPSQATSSEVLPRSYLPLVAMGIRPILSDPPAVCGGEGEEPCP